MQPITPSIKLFTYQASLEAGLQITALILEHQGNNYHLRGGTRDTIYAFTESLGIYVLTINKDLGYIGLNAFMVSEPDPLNTVFLHNLQEIRETLGKNWESMKPENITKRLITCLY
jgi:hypothetical protein